MGAIPSRKRTRIVLEPELKIRESTTGHLRTRCSALG